MFIKGVRPNDDYREGYVKGLMYSRKITTDHRAEVEAMRDEYTPQPITEMNDGIVDATCYLLLDKILRKIDGEE